MEIRTSVRNLVEFILRSGDIDNSKASSKNDAMLEGGRIHRMIQRRMGPNYFAEVSLTHVINTDKYDIVIEGRADGIIFESQGDISAIPLLGESAEALASIDSSISVTIDEIKSTHRDVTKMKAEEPVHLAQAKCYAYMYAVENGLKNIKVRMTYCNIATEEIRYFHYDYEFGELSDWFESVIREYQKWADFQYEWRNRRQLSIHETEFPFEYREGQRDLVKYVYQTIYHRRKLFIEAPTGVGKTIATVFPAVKAMGENMGERIFYLTAKTITRTVAEQALSLLREQGLSFKSVTLTAKDKICFLDEAECNPIDCEFAKGHFDRVNEALYDILTTSDNLSREEILRYAIKYRVCPFEFSLDIALFADMVICDYNYLFDPHAYLRRFFTEGVREDYTFLIDEAHNLVSRGREMYSATLVKEDFLKMKQITKNTAPKITSAIESCNKELLRLKRESVTINILSEEEEAPFVRRVLRLSGLIEDYLEDHEDSPIKKELLEFYFQISHFLLIQEKLDEKYVIFTDFADDNSFYIRLFNVDPSKNLKDCMQRGRATILFSATLLPIDYFKNLLGAEDNDYEVYAHSVFDPKNRGLFIANDVTSKYTRRNVTEFENIARYIHDIVECKMGNYMVFFPSFAFMKSVYETYTDMYGEEGILVQGASMKEAEREEFLENFEKDSQRTVIGMCVLGGIFAEGIDLKEDRLIGAIIIGTGLPMVCHERDILKRHFDEDGFNGYDYAYKFPGLNKVLQAAGRVIRTARDVGIVVLLDERFLETHYLRMFPREWSDYKIVSVNSVSNAVRGFWDKI